MVVVDDWLRVRGVLGLCVVDVFVMFFLISGNINVVSMMIGEKVVGYII